MCDVRLRRKRLLELYSLDGFFLGLLFRGMERDGMGKSHTDKQRLRMAVELWDGGPPARECRLWNPRLRFWGAHMIGTGAT